MLVHVIGAGGRVVTIVEGESMAKQSFKEQCDINQIMKKFERTGMAAHLNTFQGSYADVSAGIDYHAAMNAVSQAREVFMTLPAKVRTRFDNDPGAFLDFVDDPKNEAEMISLGLKEVPSTAPVVAPATDPVVPPVA